MVRTLNKLQMNFILLIHTNDEYGVSSSTEFSKLARSSGICIPYTGLPNKSSVDNIYKLMTNVSSNSIAVVYLGSINGAVTLLSTEKAQLSRPSSLKISWMFQSALAEHDKFQQILRNSDTIICIGCHGVTNFSLLAHHYNILLGSPYSPIASMVTSEPTNMDAKPLLDSVISLAQGVKTVLETTCLDKNIEQCSNFYSSLMNTINQTNVEVGQLFTDAGFYPYEDKTITLEGGFQEYKEIEIQKQNIVEGSLEVLFFLNFIGKECLSLPSLYGPFFHIENRKINGSVKYN